MKITVELLTQWHDNDILFFVNEATINDSIINKVLARIEGENFVKNFEKEVANA